MCFELLREKSKDIFETRSSVGEPCMSGLGGMGRGELVVEVCGAGFIAFYRTERLADWRLSTEISALSFLC